MNSNIPSPVLRAAARIQQAGGNAVLVGGAVLDLIQGREPKDWDLEVFGLGFDRIVSTFADHSPATVGKAFGIVKVSFEGVDLDLNVPRADNKVGTGHKGFEVVMDPNMSIREAARRRDFTINSMSLDLLSGEIHDPFGGRADLDAGVLRATDPTLFIQDPLRGLRAVQLLARKAKTVEPKTLELIRGMADSFEELPKERVFEEFRKLLLKAEMPSVGLQLLRDSDWIRHFPELVAMIGCEQRVEWHAEGDVWVHSLAAADAAAQVRHLVPEPLREAFVFGTFLHDVGKPAATITAAMIAANDPRAVAAAENAKRPLSEMFLTAHGHDQAGMDPAESFLRRMTDSTKLIERVRGIVGLHMQPWTLHRGNAGKGAFARLSRKAGEFGLDLHTLGQVCRCDSCATGITGKSLAGGVPNFEHAVSEKLFGFADDFASSPSSIEPKVRGRDLIERGVRPSPQMGALLREALDLQDSDPTLSRTELIGRILPPGDA